MPFHYCANDYAVINSVSTGQRPSRPENVLFPDMVWDLVVRCWQQNSQIRPSAHETYDVLQPLPLSSRNAVATAVSTAQEDLCIEFLPKSYPQVALVNNVAHPVGPTSSKCSISSAFNVCHLICSYAPRWPTEPVFFLGYDFG